MVDDTLPDLPMHEFGEEVEQALRAGYGRDVTAGWGHSVFRALESGGASPARIRLASDDAGDETDDRTATRYRVLAEIGHGAIGSVFKSRDADLGRDVALKVLRDRHAPDPAMVRRFVEEAQVAGQLQHPGIVPVYEMGLRPDRRPYFAMKLVKGETLSAKLAFRASPREDLNRLLKYLEKVVNAVAYAHARGVLHRDLKPANIMVGAYGEVLVLDWGLAKVIGREERTSSPRQAEQTDVRTVRTETPGTQSLTGSVMGTPAYMPPEQARGEVERLDERADVFALGAILCEILTGRPPYAGETVAAVREQAARAHLEEAWRRLDAADVDADLVALARACLAPDREDRPRTAEAVAARLSTYLDAAEQRKEAAEIAAAAAKARAEEEERARRLAERLAGAEVRRRKLTHVFGLAVTVLVVILGAGWTWIEKARRDRAATGMNAVFVALAEAETAATAARTSGDAVDWTRTVAEANRAAKLAASGEVEAGVRKRARDVVERLSEQAAVARLEAQQRERERVALARLDDARMIGAYEPDAALIFATFGVVFRDLGVDVSTLSVAEAARRLRATAIEENLAAALDDWATAYEKRDGEAALTEKLRAMAIAADPDPLRQRLRAAARADSPAELERILAAVDAADLPAWTVTVSAYLLEEHGRRDRALAMLHRARLRHPRHRDLNRALARVTRGDPVRPGDPAAALPFAETLVALEPESAWAWSQLGTNLGEGGERSAAMEALRRALRLRPEAHTCHIHLGKYLFESGDADGALEATRNAISQHAECSVAHFNLAVFLERLGRMDEALEAARRGVAYSKKVGPGHLTLAVQLRRTGRVDEAIALCEKIIEARPDHYRAYFLLGNCRQDKRDSDGAIAALRKSVSLHPRAVGPRLALVEEYIDQRSLEAAIELAKQVLCINPRSVMAHHQLGNAFFYAGRMDAAIECQRAALALAPNHQVAQRVLGIARQRRGDIAGAVEALRKAIAMNETDHVAVLELGSIYCDNLRDYDRAIELFERGIEIKPDLAIMHFNLGLALQRTNRLGRALTAFQEAVRLAPRYGQALLKCGFILNRLGRWHDALAPLRSAAELAPRQPLVWLHLGEAYYRLGSLRDAVTALRRALALNNMAVAHLLLGDVVSLYGDWKESAISYRAAIRLLPDRERVRLGLAYNGLGHVLHQNGRFAEAGDVSKKALELLPNHQGAQQRIHACERVSEQVDQLDALVRGEKKPDDPWAIATLAFLAQTRERYAASARIWQTLLATQNGVIREIEATMGYKPVVAAALAASGAGKDASTLTAEEVAALRDTATRWLVRAFVRLPARGNEQTNVALRQTLWQWKLDPALASLRDADALKKLPAKQRKVLTDLWTEVDAVLEALAL